MVSSVALCVACATAACATPPISVTLPVGAATPRTAYEVSGEALRTFVTAPTARYQGSLVDAQGHQIKVSMTTTAKGGAQGTLAVDAHSLDVLETASATYYRGRAFWQAASPVKGRLYGDTWVTTAPPGLSAADLQLVQPSAIISELVGGRRESLRMGSATLVNGVQAVPLSDDAGVVYVTTTTPARLVEIDSTPGQARPDGSHDLKLSFDFPPVVEVSPPARYIDPADPKTLPARFTVVGQPRQGMCDATSCVVIVTVSNSAGPQTTPSTVTVKVFSPAGAVLGTCTANPPDTGAGQTADVPCTVSGTAWAAYARMGSVKMTRAEATITNPPYDGG